MKFLILTILITSPCIFSQEKRFISSIQGTQKLPFKVKLIKTKENNLDVLSVYKNEKKEPILKHTAPLIGVILLEASVLKFKKRSILLTRWTKGAHSETLLLMDLDKPKDKVIYSSNFSWPFSYNIKDNILYIKSTDHNNQPEVTKWNP